MRSAVFTAALLAVVPAIHAQPQSNVKSGCNSALPNGVRPGASVNRTLENSKSGVKTRGYRIHLPPNYDNTKAVPLILSFHGRTQNASYQEDLSQFSNASYGFKGIAVYPEGVPIIKNHEPQQQWEGDPESNITDTQFTLELIAHLESKYCIDPARIYANGKSNGGGFALGKLACNSTTASKIAAFAAAAPAVYVNKGTGKLDECKPGRKVPIMELHGLEDDIAKYGGGSNSRLNGHTAHVVTLVNSYARVDGFQPSVNATSILCNADKSKEVKKFTWDGANETVVHYRYKNVKHDWMSATPNGDTKKNLTLLTCKETEATKLMLDWFAKWTL